jgi:serine/tyrosine/threonine adenylyltransferase
MGSMSQVDDPNYISGEYTEEQKNDVVSNGERIIEEAGEEYRSIFMDNYKALMIKVRKFETFLMQASWISNFIGR